MWGFTRGFDLGGGALVGRPTRTSRARPASTNVAVDPRFDGARRRAAAARLAAARRRAPRARSSDAETARGRARLRPRRRRQRATARRAATSARSSCSRRRRRRHAGNVLSNAGAEAGTPADDDTSSPAPPQWTRSGSFTFVRYGTVAGIFPFPSRRVGEALGAGDAFFTAGPGQGQQRHPGRRPAATPRPRSTSAWARRRCRRCSAATAASARRRDRRGGVPRPRRPRARQRCGSARSRPRTAAGATNLLPRVDLGRDPAAHAHDRGHAALDARRRRLRRRLLRLASRSSRAIAGAAAAPRPRARRRQAAAPVRRRHADVPPRARSTAAAAPGSASPAPTASCGRCTGAVTAHGAAHPPRRRAAGSPAARSRSATAATKRFPVRAQPRGRGARSARSGGCARACTWRPATARG